MRANGKLYCWGDNQYGQLGDGSNDSPVTRPKRVEPFEDWNSVSAGNYHSCGVRSHGKLYCWGADDHGQVGDNQTATSVTIPKRVGLFEDWKAVVAGGAYSCGVRTNGKLYCWGFGSGALGVGPTEDLKSPTRVGTFEDWTSVAASGPSAHTCGVRANGKLYCWGDNTYGQIGYGTVGGVPVTSPKRVGSSQDWKSAAAGYHHSCGLRTSGKWYCWGWNTYSQVGDGTLGGAPVPSPAQAGSFEDGTSVSAGGYHSCGTRANGKLYCWGNGEHGQIGDGATGSPRSVPKRVGLFADWASVSAGFHHTCGVRANGKLYCWGYTNSGQVGIGSSGDINVLSPSRV